MYVTVAFVPLTTEEVNEVIMLYQHFVKCFYFLTRKCTLLLIGILFFSWIF